MSNQCSIGFVVEMNDGQHNLVIWVIWVIWVIRPPVPARQTSAVADINAAGLSLATAHVKGCKAFWGRRNHYWVPFPIKKQEIMGFLPILNRYDMGCPSGKTYIYISCVYFWGESHPCLRTKVKTILSLFAPHLFACTNGCVSQYIPEQIYEYDIHIYIDMYRLCIYII